MGDATWDARPRHHPRHIQWARRWHNVQRLVLQTAAVQQPRGNDRQPRLVPKLLGEIPSMPILWPHATHPDEWTHRGTLQHAPRAGSCQGTPGECVGGGVLCYGRMPAPTPGKFPTSREECCCNHDPSSTALHSRPVANRSYLLLLLPEVRLIPLSPSVRGVGGEECSCPLAEEVARGDSTCSTLDRSSQATA